MNKYVLRNENKYFGQIDLNEERIISRVSFKKNSIKIFSVVLALKISFLAFSSSVKAASRDDNIDYMYEQFYLDEDVIHDELLTSKEKYKELEEEYEKMDDDEKNEYVAFIFDSIIDGSDKFTDEEKEVLKENEGDFLSEYGNNYYFNNIFGMTIRLRDVKVVRDDIFEEGVVGEYDDSYNLIRLRKDAQVGDLGHEVGHVSTIDQSSRKAGELYIIEAIRSCIDCEYYDNDSYSYIMRNHMLLLSKIVGRDNLMKVYLNNDFKLLHKLVGNRYELLMNLFDIQHSTFANQHEFNEKTCNMTAEELKNIYEKNNKCSIEDDPLMKIIYESSKFNSKYYIKSNLFDNYMGYIKNIDGSCFDRSIPVSLYYIGDNGFRLETSLVNYVKNTYHYDEINDIRNRKLNYFFSKEVVRNIVNNENPYKYLSHYLNRLGVSNGEYWSYIILDPFNPVFCSSEFLDYDEKCYGNDLRILLGNKCIEFKDNSKLYKLYKDFDIFYADKKNLNKDDFMKFWSIVVGNDEVSAKDILDSYRKDYLHVNVR